MKNGDCSRKIRGSATAAIQDSYSNIEIYDLDTSVKFSITDNSFGQFLAENLFKIQCVKINATDVTADNKIVAVDVRAGEEKSVIPTTNMFGFNFITKIVSMFNALGDAPTPEAPFGNMLPFLMMSDGEDFDPMLMFMMTQGTGGSDMFSNPMMMYFLMKDKDNMSDMLPMMMMMGMKK